jgi:TetR/AcrR family transcriptional regulator, mexJK operon transcriptional repressor
MSSKQPRVGRPRDTSKAEGILDSAWELFLMHGVEAVSIEAVARHAGVSKVTIYSSYENKSQLFNVCLQREMARIERPQGITQVQTENHSMIETLQMFGIGLMTFLATDSAVSFYGTLAAELRRSPSLAQSFWDIGPGKTQQNLAAILYEAAAAGEVTIGDPLEAAEMLIGLWQGLSNYQLALGINDQQDIQAIATRVQRGIEIFMRAYGCRQK